MGIPRLQRLVRKSDWIIPISSAIAKHWNLPQYKTTIIPNPICSKNDVIYNPVKEKYILYSSYLLTDKKGARYAVEAFCRSKLYNEGYQLKLMGNCSNDYRQILIDVAEKYNCANAIVFVPFQKDVKPYFAKATVYIMSSEFEAFGRVTAEAMFYGCPVLARATGGTLDIVRHGETGYLFETLEECSRLLVEIVHQNQERIILRAQKYAISTLSREAYRPKILEVYSSLLNTREK